MSSARWNTFACLCWLVVYVTSMVFWGCFLVGMEWCRTSWWVGKGITKLVVVCKSGMAYGLVTSGECGEPQCCNSPAFVETGPYLSWQQHVKLKGWWVSQTEWLVKWNVWWEESKLIWISFVKATCNSWGREVLELNFWLDEIEVQSDWNWSERHLWTVHATTGPGVLKPNAWLSVFDLLTHCPTCPINQFMSLSGQENSWWSNYT